jgi:hypothetical protein
MGQIVELTRSDLRDPDVCVSVPVRQKRHEVAVTGHRSGLLQSIEVRDRLKSCISYWVSPEALCPLQPEDRANRRRTRNCQRQHNSPVAKQGRRAAALVRPGGAALSSISCPDR